MLREKASGVETAAAGLGGLLRPSQRPSRRGGQNLSQCALAKMWHPARFLPCWFGRRGAAFASRPAAHSPGALTAEAARGFEGLLPHGVHVLGGEREGAAW